MSRSSVPIAERPTNRKFRGIGSTEVSKVRAVRLPGLLVLTATALLRICASAASPRGAKSIPSRPVRPAAGVCAAFARSIRPAQTFCTIPTIARAPSPTTMTANEMYTPAGIFDPTIATYSSGAMWLTASSRPHDKAPCGSRSISLVTTRAAPREWGQATRISTTANMAMFTPYFSTVALAMKTRATAQTIPSTIQIRSMVRRRATCCSDSRTPRGSVRGSVPPVARAFTRALSALLGRPLRD